MGKPVEKRTNARIRIEVDHSAQLGEEVNTIEQTRLVVTDMNPGSLGPFNRLAEEPKVVALS